MDVVAVIGLGYAGLPLAVAFGKNMPTIGYDLSAAKLVEETTGNAICLKQPVADVLSKVKLHGFFVNVTSRFGASPLWVAGARIWRL